jgi:DNA-binding HxlR family transcriptional regulator
MTEATTTTRITDEPDPMKACELLTCAFDLLGKRWTALILDLLLQRPARFNELARAIPGVSNRVLAARLRELAEAGVVERSVDPGPPTTTTYALTPLGEHLGPALGELRAWAEELIGASGSDGGRQAMSAAGSTSRKG